MVWKELLWQCDKLQGFSRYVVLICSCKLWWSCVYSMRSLPQLSIMQAELDYNMSQIPCSVFCSISTNELIDNVCLASPLRLFIQRLFRLLHRNHMSF